MKINARVELSDEEINNIIVGFAEDGSNRYWNCLEQYHPADNRIKILDVIKLEDKNNSIANSTYIIEETVIKRGINKILNDPKLEIRSDIKNNIMTDNMDAECYDCIIQVGLFGEIKYC